MAIKLVGSRKGYVTCDGCVYDVSGGCGDAAGYCGLTQVFKETGASTLTEPSAKWNGTLTLNK